MNQTLKKTQGEECSSLKEQCPPQFAEVRRHCISVPSLDFSRIQLSPRGVISQPRTQRLPQSPIKVSPPKKCYTCRPGVPVIQSMVGQLKMYRDGLKTETHLLQARLDSTRGYLEALAQEQQALAQLHQGLANDPLPNTLCCRATCLLL